MAISLSTIEKRLVARVRADVSAPSTSDLNNLHQNVIAEWANEVAPEVVQILAAQPAHFQALMEYDKKITLTSGAGALPTSPAVAAVVSVKTGSSKVHTLFTLNADEFARFSGNNFATTATEQLPVALIANGYLYVKPASISEAYIDYIKEHPTISTTQGTVWTATADQVLVELLAAKYYEYRNHVDLADRAYQRARSFAA